MSKKFGSAQFYKDALMIAVPIMLQQLIQNLVTLIDNFMVSGLGDVSMSGVNVAGQFLFIFMVYINSICMAGGIFLTQHYGAKDKAGMQQAFLFKLCMGLAAMIPFFFVTVIYPRQVLSLMLIGNNEAGAILDEGVKYIRIMFAVGIPMTVSVSIATSLRDMGKVKIPLIVTAVATLTNTLFNWLLIYGNLGFPALGVRGAAYASVIARTLEVIIFTVIYLRTKPEFAVKVRDFLKIDPGMFMTILKKGYLLLFCELTWVISETVTTATYNGRGGAEVVSGMAASFTIANLFFIAFGGIYSSTGIIIGRTLGEGNLKKARMQKNWLLSGGAVFGCIMALFGLLTTLLVPVIYGRLSDESVEICRNMVILMSCFMPVWVYLNTQQAVARAGGDTAMGIQADTSVTILVTVPMVLILGYFTDIGPVQLFLCVKLLDFLKLVLASIILKKERWLKNLTIRSA